jgi:monovalent cation:H+ antiporter-2, CPA2 family
LSSQLAFLADLTVALAAAVTGGAIASRFRVNPIIGYLFAGVVIGPFTPGYVAHGDTLDTLATIGLIFLLFSLGLGFSLREIRTLGNVALVGNAVVMVAVAAVAALGATLFRLPHPFTLGLITAVSSTAVGAALLRAWNVENARAGRFALAQLIVQDFVAVALLVIATAPATALSPLGIALPVLKALGFTAVALILGATVLARLVQHILRGVAADTLFPVFAAFALVAGGCWKSARLLL